PRADLESVDHGNCPYYRADRTDPSPVDVLSARLGDRLHGLGDGRPRLPGLLRRLVSWPGGDPWGLRAGAGSLRAIVRPGCGGSCAAAPPAPLASSAPAHSM